MPCGYSQYSAGNTGVGNRRAYLHSPQHRVSSRKRLQILLPIFNKTHIKNSLKDDCKETRLEETTQSEPKPTAGGKPAALPLFPTMSLPATRGGKGKAKAHLRCCRVNFLQSSRGCLKYGSVATLADGKPHFTGAVCLAMLSQVK